MSAELHHVTRVCAFSQGIEVAWNQVELQGLEMEKQVRHVCVCVCVCV